MDRRFALPTVSALGFTLGGCGAGDTIIGTWDISALTYDGETQALPYSSEGTTMTAELRVTEELAATFDITYAYDDGSGSETMAITGTATETDDKAIFDLSLTYGEQTFTSTCDTTDDLLSCTGLLGFEGARAEE